MRTKPLGFFAALLSAFTATTAVAQDETAETESQDIEEIVVTGTLLRGETPTGLNLITLSKEDMEATGAITMSQLLATVPQVSNFFNSLPQISANAGHLSQVLKPNLRNTPSGGSGQATLVLVDGHRMVNVGVVQAAPDPEVVPIGAIDRVEMITDGGSSTYGADAIGGVINYITRRSYDGVQVNARVGYADNYRSYDANITAGKGWDTGSLYGSYNHAQNDALLKRHRDYAKEIDWTTGEPSARGCPLPNVVIGGTSYAYPALLPNTHNACDPSQHEALYPKKERNSFFGGLSQDFNDSIRLDIRAFYTEHESTAVKQPAEGAVRITSANPHYVSVAGADAGQSQRVRFSYGPAFGNDFARTINENEIWGITPTVTTDLVGDWRFRGMVNYQRSYSSYSATDLNITLAQPYAASGLNGVFLNPYDIGAPSNSPLLANIQNFEAAGEGKGEILNYRGILDGSLFAISGGDVRLAVGVEYIKDDFQTRTGSDIRGFLGETPYSKYSRSVRSLFGEVQIPLIGNDNAMTLIRALDISASARYDEYSDFGSTSNPKLAFAYKPLDWVTLRGNWGTSFNAPTPVDQLGARNSTLRLSSFQLLPDNYSGPAPAPGALSLIISGTVEDLKPQEADTWSAGFDIEPPMVPGLRLSASYYEIEFKGFLGTLPPGGLGSLFSTFVTLNPQEEDIRDFQSKVTNPEVAEMFLGPGAVPLFEVIDFRTKNLGNTNLV